MPAAQALVAMTSFSAVSLPRSVGSRPAGAREGPDARVLEDPHARLRAPTRRRPRASAAGWTVAALGSSTPARWTDEPERRAISSGGSRRNGSTPSFSQSATTPSQAPICAVEVAVQSQPAWRKCASIPCVSQKSRDLVDRRLRAARHAQRVRRAAQADERRELRPPGEDEAAVSPRGAAAADVLLEHDDVARGLEPLDPEGRPEPDVAAAQDRDVGARVALERRRVRRVARDLLEPERAVRHEQARLYLRPRPRFSLTG